MEDKTGEVAITALEKIRVTERYLMNLHVTPILNPKITSYETSAFGTKRTCSVKDKVPDLHSTLLR